MRHSDLTLSKLVLDAAWYAAARVVPGLQHIALVFLVTHGSGTDAYGELGLMLATANVVVTAASSWINQGCYRFVPMQRFPDPNFLRMVTRATWACCAAAFVMFVLAQFGLALGAAVITTVFGAVLAAAMVSQSVSIGLLQAQGSAAAVACIEAARSALTLALVVGVIQSPWFSVGNVIAVLSLGYALAGAIGYHLASRAWRVAGAAPSATQDVSRHLRQVAGYGVPMSAWVSLYALLPFADRYFIRTMLGPAELGVYSTLYDTLVRVTALALVPIVLAAHPPVMRALAARDGARAGKILALAFALQLAAGAALVLAAWLAAPSLIPYVGVPVGAVDLRLIALLVAGGCIWQLALLGHKVLEGRGSTGTIVAAMVVAVAAAAAWNLLAIPRLGLLGAAQSLVIGAVVYVAITGFLSWRALQGFRVNRDAGSLND